MAHRADQSTHKIRGVDRPLGKKRRVKKQAAPPANTELIAPGAELPAPRQKKPHELEAEKPEDYADHEVTVPMLDFDGSEGHGTVRGRIQKKVNLAREAEIVERLREVAMLATPKEAMRLLPKATKLVATIQAEIALRDAQVCIVVLTKKAELAGGKIKKRRVYLQPGEYAPPGHATREGSKRGRYYEIEGDGARHEPRRGRRRVRTPEEIKAKARARVQRWKDELRPARHREPRMEKDFGAAPPADAMVGEDVHDDAIGSGGRRKKKREGIFEEKQLATGSVSSEDMGPRTVLEVPDSACSKGACEIFASTYGSEVLTEAVPQDINPAYGNVSVLYKDEGDEEELHDVVVGGYASPQVIDREKHLISRKAMADDLPRFLAHPKYRNVMLLHSNVQVGEVLPEWTDPKTGKVYRTEVDDVGLFCVIKIRTDKDRAPIVDEVLKDIESGKLAAFSISGDAPLESREYTCKDGTCFWYISEIIFYEITLCEEGVNQDAKLIVLSKALDTRHTCPMCAKVTKADTTLIDIAEGKIHASYTEAMDKLRELGHLDREERIALSSAITAALKVFGAEVKKLGLDTRKVPAEDAALLVKALLATGYIKKNERVFLTERLMEGIAHLNDSELGLLVNDAFPQESQAGDSESKQALREKVEVVAEGAGEEDAIQMLEDVQDAEDKAGSPGWAGPTTTGSMQDFGSSVVRAAGRGIKKARRYLGTGQAPEGVQVQEGPRGGKYYEPEPGSEAEGDLQDVSGEAWSMLAMQVVAKLQALEKPIANPYDENWPLHPDEVKVYNEVRPVVGMITPDKKTISLSDTPGTVGLHDLFWGMMLDLLSEKYRGGRDKELMVTQAEATPELREVGWVWCNILPSGGGMEVLLSGSKESMHATIQSFYKRYGRDTVDAWSFTVGEELLDIPQGYKPASPQGIAPDEFSGVDYRRLLQLQKARHSRDKCMECDLPPTVEVEWAEGMARAWFCDDHWAAWVKENPEEDVYWAVDGEVSKGVPVAAPWMDDLILDEVDQYKKFVDAGAEPDEAYDKIIEESGADKPWFGTRQDEFGYWLLHVAQDGYPIPDVRLRVDPRECGQEREPDPHWTAPALLDIWKEALAGWQEEQKANVSGRRSRRQT